MTKYTRLIEEKRETIQYMITAGFNFTQIAKAIYDCEKLQKAPRVCNPCDKKSFCNKHKLYYNSKIAQAKYEEIKKKLAKELI